MTQGEVVGTADSRNPARKLSARARAGLDVARAFAAIYVVFHHVVASVNAPELIDLLFTFGQEAVIIFFLLSGFVIFANERERVAHPRGYYLRRLRRIYPLIVIAMIVSTVLWAAGLIDAKFSWSSLFGTLFSLQDIAFLKPGVITTPYLGNDPLWSLSYEVFFYAVFPLVMIAWRRNQLATRHAVGAIAVLGYITYLAAPNHFSLVVAYFLLWWVGAMTAKSYLDGTLRISAVFPEAIWMSALIIVAVAGVVFYGSRGLGLFPILMVRHFVVAAGMALLLFTPLRGMMASLSLRVAGPAALIAGLSYGLYVLHAPLLAQTGAARTWLFLPALVGTVVLAYFSDSFLARRLPKAPRN
jgi:peptidoglycan/LPS O-acetylase OafA/YrhL